MPSISIGTRFGVTYPRRRSWRVLAAAVVALAGAAAGTAPGVGLAVAGPTTGVGPAGADPAAPQPHAAALTDTSVGACQPGASYGAPLPAKSVAATKIKDGFTFLEGPVWVADPGYLLFSDMQAASGPERVQPAIMRRYTPPSGFEEFITGAGSNGLAISADGTEILAATHDQRSISAYRLSDRSRRTVAADYQGRKFNSPNDLTVAANGTIYFTDPSFQRGSRKDEMGGRTSVFRVQNGQVSLVDDTLSQPNGIALSPDQTTLYVAGFSNNKIYKYPISSDGSIGPRAEFATIRGPDGVTVDCAGNLYWVSNPEGRVHVFAPSGAELGTISAGANATNAAFGGADRRTLYLTSGSGTGNYGLYQVQLNVPGYPF
jgi:gluconolactonase